MWILKRLFTGTDLYVSVALSLALFFYLDFPFQLPPYLFYIQAVVVILALKELQLNSEALNAVKDEVKHKKPFAHANTLMVVTGIILILSLILCLLALITPNVVSQMGYIFLTSYGVSAFILAQRFDESFRQLVNRHLN